MLRDKVNATVAQVEWRQDNKQATVLTQLTINRSAGTSNISWSLMHILLSQDHTASLCTCKHTATHVLLIKYQNSSNYIHPLFTDSLTFQQSLLHSSQRHLAAERNHSKQQPLSLFKDRFSGRIALVQVILHYSVVSSVTLSHSCTLLKPSDRFRCYSAGTVVGSNDKLSQIGVLSPDPPGKGRFGVQTPQFMQIAAATWWIKTMSDYRHSLDLFVY